MIGRTERRNEINTSHAWDQGTIRKKEQRSVVVCAWGERDMMRYDEVSRWLCMAMTYNMSDNIEDDAEG